MAAARGAGGERAVAVVLFTDLVGSTGLRSSLGEQAAEELRRRHDRLLTEAVEAHSGRVVKGLGDGIMATFAGASDAVAAAVAVQQGIDRLNRSGKSPVPLAVRIGLSAGDVSFEHDDCFGTAVIEAARLCAAAEGGTILAADVVRVLAGSGEERGYVLELKGLRDPIVAVRVGWEPATSSMIPMPPLLTDVGRIFVGREREFERLSQLWKEASAGEQRVALLAGEPGVGKTRLAAELAAQAHEEGATVLAGRCDEDLGVPYQPFVEVLRHFVDHTSSAELARRLGRYGGELVRLVPELRDGVPDLPPPLNSDPDTERYRLFDAVAAWLTAASAEDPILLVLDDLQWAAKPTLLLLRHVVRFGEPMRLFVFGTYRDSELSDASPLVEALADLRRHEAVERLSLVGLHEVDVGAFIGQVAGLARDDQSALARAIYEETDGNPFFVKEVVRHLVETGAVGLRDGRWRAGLPIEQVGIPAGVREVVGKRLTRLSAESNAVLRTAAVIGVEFEPALLEAAAGFGKEHVISALEEATTARLVSESGGGRYRFAHALVRATVYDALSAVRREAIHHKVAETLESLHGVGAGPRVTEIARHWLASVGPQATAKAIEYARWAGETALTRLAPEEAVRWFAQALEAGNRQPIFDERTHADVLLGLGRAQLFAGDPAHRKTLLQAARLAQGAGDGERLICAALANTRGTHSRSGGVDTEKIEVLDAALAVATGDTRERAVLLAMLAVELTFAGDWHRRRVLADEALAVARRLRDSATLVAVANLIYLAVSVPDTLSERLATTAEVVALAAAVDDPSAYHFACRFRCYACADAGDLHGFDRYLVEATRTAEVVGEPSLRWVAGFVRACRELLAGHIGEAEALATEAFQIGTESGQPDALPIFAGGLLEIRRHQDRLAEMEEALARAVAENPGLRVLRAKLAGLYCDLGKEHEARQLLAADVAKDFADFRYDLTWLHSMTTYGEVSARLGDVKAAGQLYERLAPWHDQVAFIYYATGGAVAHYLGMLAAALGAYDIAQAHFGEAMEIHDRLGAPYWIASTQLEWARMHRKRRRPGDGDQARALVGQALVTARELGLGNLERRAVELLR